MKKELNIKALLDLFNNTNTSYKFLFFYSLIKIIKKNNQNKTIALKKIMEEILITAWLPCFQFNLNFRKQDQTKKLLQKFTVNSKQDIKINKPTNKIIVGILKEIRFILNDKKNSEFLEKKFLRYVLVRLVRPFYKKLKNMPESGNESISKSANKILINDYKKEQPPYLIDYQNRQIILNTNWKKYILNHFHFLELWVLDEWYKYMQYQNRNSPSLYEKLKFPDFKRNSLDKQRKIWKLIIKNNSLRCIFSGELLTEDNFDIDHFVCWNFLAHDQEWNLIPVLSKVNRSKNNRLPKLHLIEPFVDFKIKSLRYSKKYLNNKKYLEYLSEHSNFINFSHTECFTDEFKIKYINEVKTLIIKAKNQGFELFNGR